MAMTVATPATMPSSVRKLRSFWATMERMANFTFSRADGAEARSIPRGHGHSYSPGGRR